LERLSEFKGVSKTSTSSFGFDSAQPPEKGAVLVPIAWKSSIRKLIFYYIYEKNSTLSTFEIKGDFGFSGLKYVPDFTFQWPT
jgi:hypothetical protein